MKIGEAVEILIRLRDSRRMSRREDDAVCAACNILSRLPAMMEEDAAKDALREFRAEYERKRAAQEDGE